MLLPFEREAVLDALALARAYMNRDAEAAAVVAANLDRPERTAMLLACWLTDALRETVPQPDEFLDAWQREEGLL